MTSPSDFSFLTHGGPFHVDEIMALALLRHFVDQNIPVVRSRNKEMIAFSQKQNNVFVVDVGLLHDPKTLNFDHHQTGMREGWDDGTPFSSCGLVWRWLVDSQKIDIDPDLILAIEKELIKPVDAHDNGLAKWPMASFFRMYNRSDVTDQENDALFLQASAAASQFLTNLIHHTEHDIYARKHLTKAWEDSIAYNQGGIVVLHEQIKNQRAHSILGEVSDYKAQFLLFPRSESRKNKHWMMRALPSAKDDPRHNALLPEEWRGVNNQKISLPSGEEMLISFSHKNGFLTQVEGKLESVYALAKHSVDRGIEHRNGFKRLNMKN